MLFNFSYHECCNCGRLTDDGGFFAEGWYCLFCIDEME